MDDAILEIVGEAAEDGAGAGDGAAGGPAAPEPAMARKSASVVWGSGWPWLPLVLSLLVCVATEAFWPFFMPANSDVQVGKPPTSISYDFWSRIKEPLVEAAPPAAAPDAAKAGGTKGGGKPPTAYDVLKANLPSATFQANDYAARVTWATCAYLHLFNCVGAFLAAIVIAGVRVPHGRDGGGGKRPYRQAHWYRWVFAICSAALVVVSVRYWTGPNKMLDIGVLVDQILVYGKLPLMGACKVLTGLSVGIAFVYALLFGAILSFQPDDDTPACLAVQSRQLRYALYIGTLVLVSDVVVTRALFNWGLLYVLPTDGRLHAAVTNLATSILTERGLYASVLLAVIYLPAAAIVKGRSLDLVREMKKTDQIKALQDHDLASTDIWSQIRPVAAIVLPLLAPWVADLLKAAMPAK